MNSKRLAVTFSLHRELLFALALAGILPVARPVSAQIVTDGSMGAAKSLTGPDFQIGADLGKQFGGNLFHSFKDFNLKNGQSATFTGPSTVHNILSRVTGGNPSSIDGSINSTIAGANLFFINPAGVIFGSHAQVNVSGSFAASTASMLKLSDGSLFSAADPGNAVLSSAAPAAFGFLGKNPAPIVVDGGSLKVNTGQTLSLIGGDIQLNGAQLSADKGKVNLVATGSQGDVTLNATKADSQPVLTGFNALGDITMDASTVDVGDYVSDPTHTAGGSVTVRGQSLSMDNRSAIRTHNEGDTAGGSLNIDLAGALAVSGESTITASAEGDGTGAGIQLHADKITLAGFGFDDGEFFTGVRTSTSGAGHGKAGAIDVSGNFIRMTDGGRIGSLSQNGAPGGNITLKAGRLVLNGFGTEPFTGIAAQAARSGNAGNINVTADSIQILGGAEISGSTRGDGRGGDIDIVAPEITIDGQGTDFFTGIVASTNGFSDLGRGGNITIKADSLQILNSGHISATVRGGARGGDITVNAKNLEISNLGTITTEVDGFAPGGTIHVNADNITIDGKGNLTTNDEGEVLNTGLVTTTFSGDTTGTAGDILVNSKNLNIVHGGGIFASTVRGSARGGTIDIHADSVVVDGVNDFADTVIAAQSIDGNPGADGGKINITAKSIKILNGGIISTGTRGSGNGGDVSLTTDRLLMDGPNSNFFTTLAAFTDGFNTKGNGGTITVHAKDVQVRGNSNISANTHSEGRGGSILIDADSILLDGALCEVTAKTDGFLDPGRGGDITFNSKLFTQSNGATIFANTENEARGGDVTITSDKVNITSGGSINASTTGLGQGGDVTVEGNDILLDGQGSTDLTGILAQTEGTGPKGPGGTVQIQADNLTVTNGATVSTSTLGRGQGGDILINAGELNLDHAGTIQASSHPNDDVAGRNRGGGGGNINIQAGNVHVSSGAAIKTDSLAGGGRGGDINVNASRSIDINDGGAITAAAVTGSGGNIALEAGDSIQLHDSQITSSAGKNGGSLTLKAARMIYLRNSLLSAIANGNGGNITIDPRFVIFDNSQVRADAIRGNGGNILIQAKVFIPSATSVISASSKFGVAGNIAIESPVTNVGASLIQLPSNPLNAENFLPERCIIKQTGQNSSFTVETRRGTPPLPDAPVPSVAVQ